MSTEWRSRARLVVRVLAAVGFSFFAISAIAGTALTGLDAVDDAEARLMTLDARWIAIALGVWATSLIVQGFRWRALLAVEPRPSPWMMGQVLFGSNVLNLALPGPVGELAAAWYLRHRHGVPMLVGLAATLAGRLLALTVFGMLTLVLWPLVASDLPDALVRWVTPLALMVGLSVVPLLILGFQRDRVVALARAAVERLLSGERRERVLARILWWVRCFSAVGGVGWTRWAQAVGWCCANLAILSASTLCTLRAASIPADPLGTLFMQSFTAVVSVAGVLVPGGMGAVEVAVIGLFPTFAQGSTADAVFCAMVFRWVHLLTLLAGVPWMVWLVATLPGRAESLVPLLQGALDQESEAGPGAA